MRTWRPSGCQKKRRAALGLAASSVPLRLRRLVKKSNPRGPCAFSSTIRADGAPPGVAVARPMASGCGTPAS